MKPQSASARLCNRRHLQVTTGISEFQLIVSACGRLVKCEYSDNLRCCRPCLRAGQLPYTGEMWNPVRHSRAALKGFALLSIIVVILATLWLVDPRVARLWLN